MQAEDLWREARSLLHVHTEENNLRARALFAEAIRLRPDFARAHGHKSYTFVRGYMYGWDPDPQAAQAMALKLAERALALDPEDYDNHWSLGVALLWNDRHGEAVKAYEEAVRRNPQDADLLASMSDALVAVGRAADAVRQTHRAIKLNPHHPAWYLWNLGLAHFVLGQHNEAIRTLLVATGRINAARVHLAAAYVARGEPADPQLGRPSDLERAAREIRELLRHEPQWTLDLAARQPLQDTGLRSRLLDALKAAGLP